MFVADGTRERLATQRRASWADNVLAPPWKPAWYWGSVRTRCATPSTSTWPPGRHPPRPMTKAWKLDRLPP